jgi:hypothetical protein
MSGRTKLQGHAVVQPQPQHWQPARIADLELDRDLISPKESFFVLPLQGYGPHGSLRPQPAQDKDAKERVEQVKEKLHPGEKGHCHQEDEERQQSAHVPLSFSR